MVENTFEMIFKTLDRDEIYKKTGYRIFTTFYEDFSIADAFGTKGILETYQRAKREWKHDYKYMSEMALIIGMKISEWSVKRNMDYVNAYCEVIEDLRGYIFRNFTYKQLDYFYGVVDCLEKI